MSDRPLYAVVPIEVLTSRTLSSGAKILFGLVAYTSGYPNMTRPIWYKNGSLAKLLGCSKPTLKRLKKELIGAGLIRREIVDRTCLVTPKRITEEAMKDLDPTVNNGARSILQEGWKGLKNEPLLGSKMSPPPEAAFPEREEKGYTIMETIKRNNLGEESPKKKGGVEASMSTGGEIGKRADAKRKKRTSESHYDSRIRVLMSESRFDPENASPEHFCKRLAALITANLVETGDPPQIGNNPSKTANAAMRRAISTFKDLGVSRPEFLKILEWLIPGWEKGLKRGISDQPFSIFTLHYRSKQILSAYRSERENKQPEDEGESEEDIEQTREELGDLGRYY